MVKQSTALPTVKNSLNASFFPKKLRKMSDVSLTIPDQTMSMRELLERHSRGMSLNGLGREEYYDEDGDQLGINPKTLDLVDIENMRKENAEFLESERKSWESKKSASQKAKEKAKLRLEWEKEMAEKEAAKEH